MKWSMPMIVTLLQKKRKKERIYDNAKKVLTENNLLVNEEKTENTTIERGTKGRRSRMEKRYQAGIKAW